VAAARLAAHASAAAPNVAGWGEDGALDAIKAYADTIDAVARRIEGAVQPPTETVDGVHTIAV
jgi:hypothetical protein